MSWLTKEMLYMSKPFNLWAEENGHATRAKTGEYPGETFIKLINEMQEKIDNLQTAETNNGFNQTQTNTQ